MVWAYFEKKKKKNKQTKRILIFVMLHFLKNRDPAFVAFAFVPYTWGGSGGLSGQGQNETMVPRRGNKEKLALLHSKRFEEMKQSIGSQRDHSKVPSCTK